jgi:hypothetical protein
VLLAELVHLSNVHVKYFAHGSLFAFFLFDVLAETFHVAVVICFLTLLLLLALNIELISGILHPQVEVTLVTISDLTA